MAKKIEDVLAAIGRQEEIVDKLSKILTGPRDRAYVVCSTSDCKHNVKGYCSIYTVNAPPEREQEGVCKDYEV